MTHYYSPSDKMEFNPMVGKNVYVERGFYHPAAHGPRKLPVEREDGNYDFIDNPECRIPPDAVEITDEYYAELLDGQCQGKLIVPGPDGKPILQDRPKK